MKLSFPITYCEKVIQASSMFWYFQMLFKVHTGCFPMSALKSKMLGSYFDVSGITQNLNPSLQLLTSVSEFALFEAPQAEVNEYSIFNNQNDHKIDKLTSYPCLLCRSSKSNFSVSSLITFSHSSSALDLNPSFPRSIRVS